MSIIPNDANFIDRAGNSYLDWMASLGTNGDRAAGFIRNRINHRPPVNASPIQIVASTANNLAGSVALGASIPFTAIAWCGESIAKRFTATSVEVVATAEVTQVARHVMSDQNNLGPAAILEAQQVTSIPTTIPETLAIAEAETVEEILAREIAAVIGESHRGYLE